ncbi:glycoside hydrolase family 15 protein [Brevibacillus dissolubilis]|uniref:glycoside hydrolase family 15 protein n=1 Tax=Brevibacillus dissolubilis TaxID=1844116 RepID=UPI0011175FA4|nr:glycoside hydrolase family 15 protein [Brevibacillus dissolubilis]
MPRPLVIGNGKMLINFDDRLRMRDLYYPYVGMHNHIGGHFSKMGVWVDGQFSWLDDDGWQRSLRYMRDSLVTDVTARHEGMNLTLHMEDAVHQRENIYIKRVRVCNHADTPREVRLFFHHDLNLNETEVGDTAVYDPTLGTVYHYKRNTYIMINGRTDEGGIYQYSIGIKRFNHAEGTWRDAEDGELDGNPIAQGSVDSTISFRLTLDAYEEKTINYWITISDSYSHVKRLNQYVVDNDPNHLLTRIGVYWQRWANKQEQDFANLSQDLIDLYKKSLLIVKTQTDQHGAILAANDTDILQFNRDHYSYMWPRDGALVALAMTRAGYDGSVSRFFQFCSDVLTKNGHLLHKYNPDGSVGSSWHPFIQNGEIHLPIQEDETALVLYALWEYYVHSGQLEYCQELYASLIRPAARFLASYIDEELGLPQPSYDLWEERRGIFTFTCSAVYAGLKAAANFAKLFGDDHRHTRYDEAAERIKTSMARHLYDEKAGRFLRGIYLEPDRTISQDPIIESSMFSLFSFGVFPPDDPRIINTINAMKQKLLVKTEIGGYARYENDYYFQKTTDIARIPGNPWIICTLWIAEWEIAQAQSLDELTEPLKKLQWVNRHAMESGGLPEQLDPFTGEPLSVAPLTWSHSTYVMTVTQYVKKYRQLQSTAKEGE